jgi:hypothetical protein
MSGKSDALALGSQWAYLSRRDFAASNRQKTVFVIGSATHCLSISLKKGSQMAVDDVANLRRLREILRDRRRKLVAKMVGSKKEPKSFAPFVELQEACDAVEWALEDEVAAGKKDELR